MSKRDQNTENFLFDSIRSGNIEAYEVLFKKYYLSMCIVACRLIGDEDIAKDITQEVFIHSTLAFVLYAASPPFK